MSVKQPAEGASGIDSSILSEEPHMTPDLPTVASDEALEKVAALLLKSKFPLILTAEVGRFVGGAETVAGLIVMRDLPLVLIVLSLSFSDRKSTRLNSSHT